jgi:hypothetical protein
MKNLSLQHISRWIQVYGLCVLLAGGVLGSSPETAAAGMSEPDKPDYPSAKVLLLGVGDSLTQGTMDAFNTKMHTKKAFLHLVSKRLRRAGMPIKFVQPFLDRQGLRLKPSAVPTNLGVDGEDIFSLVGLEYGKRAGTSENFLSEEYVCDQPSPQMFSDMHDQVLYPINLQAGKAVTQMDALIWHLNHRAGRAVVCFWVGNNDSGLAALGLGGKNPEFLPIPYSHLKHKLKPSLQVLLEYGKNRGDLAFGPFSPQSIARNLTDRKDFITQYNEILLRLNSEADLGTCDIFVCTFPYYCDIGYLFDRQDLSYYLDTPQYRVPQINGKVSLLTFICLYALLMDGETQVVDQILLGEDDLVLSTSGSKEYKAIKSRIRAFNRCVKSLPGVHVISTGEKLNLLFKKGLDVDGITLARNWGRGGAFSMDGVHPGHTVHAHIANLVLDRMNTEWGESAALYDLPSILKKDPYVDHDGDGWVKGPSIEGYGRTRILYLFKDTDGDKGTDPLGQAVIDGMRSEDIWNLISDALLEEIVDIPAIQAEAVRLGYWPLPKRR